MPTNRDLSLSRLISRCCHRGQEDMTWLNSRRGVVTFLLLWLAIAIFWILVLLGVLPHRRTWGPEPWLWLAAAWMAVLGLIRKLRHLPSRPEKQVTEKLD